MAGRRPIEGDARAATSAGAMPADAFRYPFSTYGCVITSRK